MLIFVSDLHLVDHPARGSFDAAAFLETMHSLVDRNSGDRDDPIKLVLLGDIFELLKADAWHRHGVRPWSEPGARLSSVSCEILQTIRDENAAFFEGLAELRRNHGVSFAYLPGNHDALIGNREVTGVRSLLRSLLPGLEGQEDDVSR